MAKHTHVIRKRISASLKRSDTIDNAIKTLVLLATNNAESLGIEEVPAATMRLCAKDLLEMGIDVEKQLEEYLKESASEEDEPDQQTALNKENSVVIKMDR